MALIESAIHRWVKQHHTVLYSRHACREQFALWLELDLFLISGGVRNNFDAEREGVLHGARGVDMIVLLVGEKLGLVDNLILMGKLAVLGQLLQLLKGMVRFNGAHDTVP